MLTVFAVHATQAQDLIKQVPENAEFVTVINNKAIVKHSSFEKINAVLSQLGAFDALDRDQQERTQDIMDLDMSYDRNGYIYRVNNDSLYYIGVLVPLKQENKIEQRLFSDFKTLPTENGYQRRVSPDGKMQAAWNNNVLFLFTGSVNNRYFEREEVANRYGIEIPQYDAAVDTVYAEAAVPYPSEGEAIDETQEWEEVDLDTVEEAAIAVDSAAAFIYEEATLADSVETEWEAHDFTLEGDSIEGYTYNYGDDEYDNDAYTDSMYQIEMARNAKNDSIRNNLFTTWLAHDFNTYLLPQKNLSSNKDILAFDPKNTLVRLWVNDLDDVYKNALPYDALTMAYGIKMQNLNYGYKEAMFDLVQDKHTMKLKGAIGLDKEMEQVFKKIYKTKSNPRFSKYIPQNHLGYFSLNINTEGYLQQMPALFDRWYGPLLTEHADLVSIAGMALEIAVDEKAIGKVMRGDHLLFVNDLQKVNTEYTDYEYDEDYNYTEVTKTKEEYIPSFLWMFTSEDQRLYKKLLTYGEKVVKIQEEDGIYTILENKSTTIYITFKDNIVFISNDHEQILSIKENRFRSVANGQIKKDIQNNILNAVVHTAAIPETLNKLGVPVINSWKKTVDQLSNYGDIAVRAHGLKGNKLTGEVTITFPRQSENALQYLLDQLILNVDERMTTSLW